MPPPKINKLLKLEIITYMYDTLHFDKKEENPALFSIIFVYQQ